MTCVIGNRPEVSILVTPQGCSLSVNVCRLLYLILDFFLLLSHPCYYYRKAVNAQKLQDENLGPDIRALDPYMRPESRDFNNFQFKHSALKNTEHGVVCSWKAAAAYANSEQKTRDLVIAKIKAEQEEAATSS